MFIRNGSERNLLNQIARLAGHITPETTLQTYTHNMDELLFETLLAEKTIKSSILTKLAGITFSPVEQDLNINEVVRLLFPKIKRFIGDIATTYAGQSILPPQIASQNYTIDSCINVLRMADKNFAIAEIASQCSIYTQQVDQWLNSAGEVKNHFQTSKRESRLFGSGDPRLSARLCLDTVETHLQLKLQKALLAACERNPRDIAWLINKVLNNVSHDHSEVVLNDPLTAQGIVCLTEAVIPNSLWRLEVDPLQNDTYSCLSAWKSALPNIVVKKTNLVVRRKSAFPYGRGRLYLGHPKQQEKVASSSHGKYSSAVLKYTLHSIAIFLWEGLAPLINETDHLDRAG